MKIANKNAELIKAFSKVKYVVNNSNLGFDFDRNKCKILLNHKRKLVIGIPAKQFVPVKGALVIDGDIRRPTKGIIWLSECMLFDDYPTAPIRYIIVNDILYLSKDMSGKDDKW
jgi:hypothetical protein